MSHKIRQIHTHNRKKLFFEKTFCHFSNPFAPFKNSDGNASAIPPFPAIPPRDSAITAKNARQKNKSRLFRPVKTRNANPNRPRVLKRSENSRGICGVCAQAHSRKRRAYGASSAIAGDHAKKIEKKTIAKTEYMTAPAPFYRMQRPTEQHPACFRKSIVWRQM